MSQWSRPKLLSSAVRAWCVRCPFIWQCEQTVQRSSECSSSETVRNQPVALRKWLILLTHAAGSSATTLRLNWMLIIGKVFTAALPVSRCGNWLAALDDFRNWLIREAA